MRVALFTDSAWLDEELPGFLSLLAGLNAECFSPLAIMPKQAMQLADLNIGHDPIFWEPSGLPVYGPWLVSRLKEKLVAEKVSLLHACTFSLWPAVLELSLEMAVPAVLCVDSLPESQRASGLKEKVRAGHVRLVGSTSIISGSLGRSLGMTDEMPETVWPSVHETATRRLAAPAPGTLCLSVCGSGEVGGEMTALLDAVATLVDRYPMTQFFFDALDRDARYLWKALSQAKLLHNVSMVPSRFGHHELLLKADCIVFPEPLGKPRGIMMSAMAGGVPIVARVDDALDTLTNYPLFVPVDKPTESHWVDALEPRLANPAADWSRTQEASAWAIARFPSHAPGHRFAGIYREMLAMPLPFRTTGLRPAGK
jgi:glycosyltransferase involved in cell wall biosynthesis